MKRFSIILFGIVFVVVNLSFGTVREVPQMYPTIGIAVQNSLPYDTVLISQGLYYEQIVIRNHPLTIAGAFLFSNDTTDIQNTIVLPPDSLMFTTTRSVFVIDSTSFFQLIGLTVRNGMGTRVFLNPSDTTAGTYLGGNIKADSTNLIIRNCQIIRGTAQMGGGIGLRRGKLMMMNCLVDSCFGNSRYRNGGGISASESDSVIIHGSTIQNNTHQRNGGGFYLSTTYSELINNTIRNNHADSLGGAGFFFRMWKIENNLVYNNSAAEKAIFWINNYPISTSTAFSIKNNTFANNFLTPSNRVYQETLGIFLDNSNQHSWQVEDNVFSNNQSSYMLGSVITTQFGSINLKRNQFVNNNAISYVILTARQYVVAYFDSNYFYGNNSNSLFYLYNSQLNATNNDFVNNQNVIIASPSGTTFINNYWGHPSGPRTASNPGGQGDSIPTGVPFMPFRTTPVFPELDVRGFGDGNDRGQNGSGLPSTITIEKVYPNPTNSTLTVDYTISRPQLITIKLYDTNGREVYTSLPQLQVAGSHTFSLQTDGIASGLYFLKLSSPTSPTESALQKVVLLK